MEKIVDFNAKHYSTVLTVCKTVRVGVPLKV